MAERLLSVRGVRVPPDWAPKAIRMINEIVGERVNRYAYAEKGATYCVGGAWLAERSVYEAMTIFRQQRPHRPPTRGRHIRPHSKRLARPR